MRYLHFLFFMATCFSQSNVVFPKYFKNDSIFFELTQTADSAVLYLNVLEVDTSFQCSLIVGGIAIPSNIATLPVTKNKYIQEFTLSFHIQMTMNNLSGKLDCPEIIFHPIEKGYHPYLLTFFPSPFHNIVDGTQPSTFLLGSTLPMISNKNDLFLTSGTSVLSRYSSNSWSEVADLTGSNGSEELDDSLYSLIDDYLLHINGTHLNLVLRLDYSGIYDHISNDTLHFTSSSFQSISNQIATSTSDGILSADDWVDFDFRSTVFWHLSGTTVIHEGSVAFDLTDPDYIMSDPFNAVFVEVADTIKADYVYAKYPSAKSILTKSGAMVITLPASEGHESNFDFLLSPSITTSIEFIPASGDKLWDQRTSASRFDIPSEANSITITDLPFISLVDVGGGWVLR